MQCFASKQVISEGERCRVIAILQSKTFDRAKASYNGAELALYGAFNTTVGLDAFWEPASMFMRATYSDCGDTDVDDTPDNRIILVSLYQELYHRVAVVGLGENSAHDIEFDFKALLQTNAPTLHAMLDATRPGRQGLDAAALDFRELQDVWRPLQTAVQEGRVFMADYAGVLRPLAFTLVHEDAYKQLITLAEKKKSYDGRLYRREHYFGRKLKELQALNDSDKSAVMRQFLVSERVREALKLGLNKSSNLLMRPYVTQILAESKKIHNGEPVGNFLAALKELLDGLYAAVGLDTCNIQFQPSAYAGQDYANATGKLYARFISATSKGVCATHQAATV